MQKVLLYSLAASASAFSFPGVKTSDDTCTIPDPNKVDCGFVGVDQQGCEAKNCCWQPTGTGENDTPWCFYKSGSAPQCFKLSTSTTPAFSAADVTKFTGYFMANINVQGVGAVVAAPDHNTPGGSYYYHWERDGALTMRTVFDTQQNSDPLMESYTNWVLKVQNQADPNNIDIRTEPKYTIPDGVPYTGAWCRPQTDGPSLRAAALIEYAQYLLKSGKKDYVLQNLWTGDASVKNGGAIKYDLDWVEANWQQQGCDLWEEIESTNFFWNRINFKRSMQLGAELASAMGDTDSANRYKQAASDIINTLDSHWTGSFIEESDNRPQDGATIVALNDGYYESDGLYKPTDSKVAATIKTLIDTFCAEYTINQEDYKNGIAGILLGRYPGDSYAGGNPWILISGALATLFFRGASTVVKENGGVSEEAMVIWRQIFGLEENANPEPLELAKLFAASGDGVLERIAYHIKGDDFHMDEQLDKNTGAQISAKDLTWSYAEVIKAMSSKGKYMKLIEKKILDNKGPVESSTK